MKAKYIQRMDRPRLERITAGCIRDCVNQHGPIHTREQMESAAKRVVAQILATIAEDIEREKAAREALRASGQP